MSDSVGSLLSEDDIFVVTIPGLSSKHSWVHAWIKAECRAVEEREKGFPSCACQTVLPDVACVDGPHEINFATNQPKAEAKEGSLVVSSYESGGFIYRREGGDWKIIGAQPNRGRQQ